MRLGSAAGTAGPLSGAAAATFQSGAHRLSPALAAGTLSISARCYLELQQPQHAARGTAHQLRTRLSPPKLPSTPKQLAHALLLAGQESSGRGGSCCGRRSQDSAAGRPPAERRCEYRLALALQSDDRSQPKRLPLFAAGDQRAVLRTPRLLINAGLAYVQTGDAPTGTALYLRALALAPANATLHEDLGVAYLQQNNLNDALIEFRAGLALDPR